MTRKTSTSAKVEMKVKRTRAEKTLASKMLRRLREGTDVRSRKARRLRAAIRVDRYENDLKLQIALERLVESLR
jgi:hypothetical protein